MGLAASTVKHLLLLLNFILTVLGIILIGVGIFILISGAENKIDHGENVAGGLIISLGVVIVIIALFGCIAAIHESKNKLIVFLILLVILILIQLMMMGMASHGTKDGLSGSIRQGFDELWEIEKKDSLKTTLPRALAYYENWLKCCGVNGTSDYKVIRHYLPASCCLDQRCNVHANIITVGCQEKFEEYLSDKLLTFNITCWILVLLEIVIAVFGWMFLSSLQNESRRRANSGWM